MPRAPHAERRSRGPVLAVVGGGLLLRPTVADDDVRDGTSSSRRRRASSPRSCHVSRSRGWVTTITSLAAKIRSSSSSAVAGFGSPTSPRATIFCARAQASERSRRRTRLRELAVDVRRDVVDARGEHGCEHVDLHVLTAVPKDELRGALSRREPRWPRLTTDGPRAGSPGPTPPRSSFGARVLGGRGGIRARARGQPTPWRLRIPRDRPPARKATR